MINDLIWLNYRVNTAKGQKLQLCIKTCTEKVTHTEILLQNTYHILSINALLTTLWQSNT